MKGKTTDTQLIYETLRDEIMFLQLAPGEGISEAEIGKRFEVSRTPVREVFKRLEQDGLLEVRPQRGTFVTLIDLAVLYDMLFVREALEVAVLRELCLRINENGLLKLKLLLLDQQKLLSAGLPLEEGVRAFLTADNRFHEALFVLADRHGVWELFAVQRPHYNRFRILNDGLNDQMAQTIYQRHQDLVDALSCRDLKRLEALSSQHMYNRVDNITAILRAFPDYFILRQ